MDNSSSASFFSSSSSVDSISHEENSTMESGFLPYSERPETYIVPVVFLFIFVTGIIGNVTLIALLIKENLIKIPSYLYILNLSVGDLIVIIGTVPFAGTIYTFESWPFGLFACKFSEFIRDVSIGVSVMTLSAMSIDRYKAAFSKTIRAPAHTRLAQASTSFSSIWLSLKTPTGGIMALIWIVSMSLAAPTAYFSFILSFKVPLHNSNKEKTINVCYPFPEELDQYYYRKIVVLFKCLFYYVVPLVIITCCYVSIAIHLVRKSKQAATVPALHSSLRSTGNHLETTLMTEDRDVEEGVSSAPERLSTPSPGQHSPNGHDHQHKSKVRSIHGNPTDNFFNQHQFNSRPAQLTGILTVGTTRLGELCGARHPTGAD